MAKPTDRTFRDAAAIDIMFLPLNWVPWRAFNLKEQESRTLGDSELSLIPPLDVSLIINKCTFTGPLAARVDIKGALAGMCHKRIILHRNYAQFTTNCSWSIGTFHTLFPNLTNSTKNHLKMTYFIEFWYSSLDNCCQTKCLIILMKWPIACNFNAESHTVVYKVQIFYKFQTQSQNNLMLSSN